MNLGDVALNATLMPVGSVSGLIWFNATLANGFTLAGHRQLQYARDPYKNVHLRGAVNGLIGGDVVTTLPSGYRPVSQEVMATYAPGTGAPLRFDVLTNGQILFFAGGELIVEGTTFQVI